VACDVVEVREHPVHQAEIDLAQTERIHAAHADLASVDRLGLAGGAGDIRSSFRSITFSNPD
jgi:hypothetical protein